MAGNNHHELVNLLETVLLNDGFLGDFHTDKATCLINATDNSIYEVQPLAVAAPKDHQDVLRLINCVQQKPFHDLYFCARGGGTGTNGQSLTNGVVLDFSRYMTRVLEFNPEEQTIVVEPGVILSDLNRMLQKHGLFFAPNVSTADRATIGGMIATDAAGKGSLIYGKTADHFLGMQLILADGSVLDTLSDNPAASQQLQKIEQNISELLTPLQAEIEARFPPLKRPLSGYNIKQCFSDGTLNLQRLIAGSEGTLGLVTAAKLKLLPIPNFKALMVIHYPSFLEALRDAQFLIQFSPLAIEAIDEKVQQSAQTMPNWPALAKMLNCEGKAYISNFMELVADTQAELDAKLAEIESALNAKSANYVTIRDNSQINQLWSIRSLAVGLVGKLPGIKKPIAFVEDAIVPPENLADFVADLQIELNQLGYNYAMYGHVDVGCIHVRPALNMQDVADRGQIRPITETVIRLLNKYQGILWGEHGKGYRGEFVPAVFGAKLYPALCAIKRLFDPANRFNPGKLTAPDAATQLQRIELVPMRGELDQIIPEGEQKAFAGAMLCNGNAACFNQEPANVMCPSYKITKDRIHSPKGRAMLVKQWLREKAKPNGNHQQAAYAAYAALNGCLGCKGCAGKCPTQVSIPDLRAQFLHSYHRDYQKRSLRDLMIGHIESLLPLAAKFPKMWNFIHRNRLAPSLGLSNIPLFQNTDSLSGGLKRLDVAIYSDSTQASELPSNAVVFFVDVFTGFLDNSVVFAAVELAQKLGLKPYIIYPRASGKSLIVGGFINEFKRNSAKLATLLNPLLERKIPVLGLENTLTTLFRDEVRKFATPLSGQVQSLAEFFSTYIEQLTQCKTKVAGTVSYCLLPHCSEQALMPAEATNWQKIYNALGVKLEVKSLGCCGMAGTYGHLKEHQDNSVGLFKLNWHNTVTSENVNYLASGFSCRSQSAKLAGKNLPHPVEIINKILN